MYNEDYIDLYEEIGGYAGLKEAINFFNINVSSFDSDDLEGVLSQLIAMKREYTYL